MAQNLWLEFQNRFDLSEEQLNLFKKYTELLQEWSDKINLTTITSIEDIINYHFQDSLAVCKFQDFSKISSICDIGTGAGFPGIPLKIKFPQIKVTLIEVNQKKVNFLNELIKELNLQNIEISDLDWRTFLRKTDYQLNLFISRASLQTDELLRMFKPSCVYKNSKLIYWASKQWKPTTADLAHLKKEEIYKVGNKQRKLIFFSA